MVTITIITLSTPAQPLHPQLAELFHPQAQEASPFPAASPPCPSFSDGHLVFEPTGRGRLRRHLRVRRVGSPDDRHDEPLEQLPFAVRLHALRSRMAPKVGGLDSATPLPLHNSILSSSAQSRDAAPANSPPPNHTSPAEPFPFPGRLAPPHGPLLHATPNQTTTPSCQIPASTAAQTVHQSPSPAETNPDNDLSRTRNYSTPRCWRIPE